MRSAFARALIPVTIITFCGLCALAPLYLTVGIITKQMQEKTN
jgi:hypothetical protein|tara:strand:+ start:636 stop:764 length:129 start_codon:yes stop_codon:yes gene_type:complete